jgi:hypothetical protein
MKNRNGYYLEYDIVVSGEKVTSLHGGPRSWVTFSSSLNAAKRNTKGFYHRTKETKFKFTKVLVLGENITWEEYINLSKNYTCKH